MGEMQSAHVFALNVANAGLGIFVAVLVLAVLVPALYDATGNLRRKRRERRQMAAARPQAGVGWNAPTRAFCSERDAL